MNADLLDAPEKLRNKTNSEIKQVKNEFYSAVSDNLKRNSNELWKFMKRYGKDENNISYLYVGNDCITDEVENAQ